MRYLALLLLLSACATTAGYKKAMEQWKGHHESLLISQWGIPDRIYEHGGVRYLEYMQASSPDYMAFSHGPFVQVNSSQYWCKTTFVVSADSGTILGASWEGNNCVH